MSYCRWSSDDYQCDAYVWEDVQGGWRTEIAGRRYVFLKPLPDPITAEPGTDEWADQWMARNEAMRAILDDGTAYTWQSHAEPEGGWSYWHDTPGECADNLERLRGFGFNVPRDAIDALREEHVDRVDVQGSGRAREEAAS